jgi:hypothetical protein
MLIRSGAVQVPRRTEIHRFDPVRQLAEERRKVAAA